MTRREAERRVEETGFLGGRGFEEHEGANRYDAIVIGSGVSGLTSAIILAKEGRRVLVLERHRRLGGYLHRFFRKGGRAFDVGFHYVGGVQEDQVLATYLRYCDVWDRIRFLPLDPEGYDELRFPFGHFRVPAGADRLRERLSRCFPASAPAIEGYIDDIRRIVKDFGLYNVAVSDDIRRSERWMLSPLGSYLDERIRDARLRAILCGQNPLYGVEPVRAPLGLHALVTDSFLQGPCAIQGGGDALAQAMADRIRELGGEVRTRREVTSIRVKEDRQVEGVTTARGETFFAPIVVSSAHPKTTVRLLPDGVLRRGYRRRVLGMEDGPGSFSLFITTDADLDDYAGYNIYNYRVSTVDAIYGPSGGPERFAFVTVPTAREGRTREGRHIVVALSLMRFSDVVTWSASKTGERGPAYEAFKARWTETMLGLVIEAIPELRGRIVDCEAATPLTNRDYTASEEGAAYGIHHAVEQSGRYGLRPSTRVGGLYLTGQSILMPGVLGATISAFYTCSLIFGAEHLVRRVREATR